MDKVVKAYKKHQQLLIGISIGLIIALLAGIYVNSLNRTIPKHSQGGQDSVGEPVIEKEELAQPKESASEEQSASSQQQAPTVKPFVASVCTKEFIPRPPAITVVKDHMYVDSQPHYVAGMDGWRQTCTRNSDGYKPDDVVLEPVPDQIWVGTKERE